MPTPNETQGNVTSLPRGGRDGFIADTAIRLDRLETAVERLQRDGELMRNALDALVDHAEQTKRLRAFEESLRNSREYKIEEMVRTSRDLKSRLDRMEGDKSSFAALPLTTWDAVNRRLQELTTLSGQIEASERRVRYNAYMLYASLFVLAATLVAYFLPVVGPAIGLN
jgi:hypothetical protein